MCSVLVGASLKPTGLFWNSSIKLKVVVMNCILIMFCRFQPGPKGLIRICKAQRTHDKQTKKIRILPGRKLFPCRTLVILHMVGAFPKSSMKHLWTWTLWRSCFGGWESRDWGNPCTGVPVMCLPCSFWQITYTGVSHVIYNKES